MKKFFYFFSVVAVITIATFNVMTLRSELDMSQLRLANIEALSDESGGGSGNGESSEWGCGGNSTYVKNKTLKSRICPNGGTHLSCKAEAGVCCDPSKQTDCDGIITI